MSYETDQRLKSYLDTNQLAREQMCRSVVELDRRFSEVIPRHPRGGRDGGRDIQAKFKDEFLTFGGVGFVNQANDSKEQKLQIKNKFRHDVVSALSTDEKPLVFIFLTNINLTAGEKDELNEFAKEQGFSISEIMDRERIRIILDSPDGFSIRFQHLGISLSEPEQASFFAKWGDGINSLVSSGFETINNKLDRIIFLHESSEKLQQFELCFQLDRKYTAEEIGHFRALCNMYFNGAKENISGTLFGISDRSNRFESGLVSKLASQPSGIQHGISLGTWVSFSEQESGMKIDHDNQIDESYIEEKFELVGRGSSIGKEEFEFIRIFFGHPNRMRLKDLDRARYLPILNDSLARKLNTIHVYANGYKIDEIDKTDFSIDDRDIKSALPKTFLPEELSDNWVRIRPLNTYWFKVSFLKRTPRRLFESSQTTDSLEKQ